MDRHSFPSRRGALLGLASLGAASLAAAQGIDELLDYAPRAAPPPGYAPEYAATVRAAEDEGRLVVYATTDADVVQPLLEDFQAMYPRIRVDYEDLTSTELHHRFVAETQLGHDTADVLWSSAMDLQASLVEKGYALAYASPEGAGLPGWARWRDQAWATTFEPVVVAYDRKQLPDAQVPRTRAGLARLIAEDAARFKGKVVTYDIEKSGLGFFLAAQDAHQGPAFWEMAEAMGKAGVRFASTTAAMLRQVASGQAALAYNVLGAYTLAQARRQADIGVLFPGDHTLVLSRLQLISRNAAHRNAARLWVDYTLSRRGQALMANRAGLYAVRSDVQGDATAARLAQQLGQSIRPIEPGAGLTQHLDVQAYRSFILRWRQATGQPVRR